MMKRLLSVVVILSLLISSVSYGIDYESMLFSVVIDPSESISTGAYSKQGESVFFENHGVHEKSVEYYANVLGGTIFFDKDGVTSLVVPLISDEQNESYWAFKESFIDSKFKIKPLKSTATKYNFLVGDKSKHQKNVTGYTSLVASEIYKNIDVIYNINQMTVEKVFTVNPGGLVSDIQMIVEGAEQLEMDAEGAILYVTPEGYMKLSAPYAYQIIDGIEIEVEVNYEIDENTYGFNVGEYDASYPLIIDPSYIASYFGGSAAYSEVYAITTDSEENVFVTGSARYSTFPVTTGSYDVSINGSRDVFISKFDPKFENLLSSTFLGADGTSSEAGLDIAIGSDNTVYVTGFTDTTSGFPFVMNGYDTTLDTDAGFVVRLDNDLTTLVSSTFIDHVYQSQSILIEPSGDILIGGTAKGSFETTSGAYQETASASYNSMFLSRYDSNLTTLMDSTYLTSNGGDEFSGMDLSSNGDILITGSTYSNNFPTTLNAYMSTTTGNFDVTVSVMSNDLTSLKASTIFGSTGLDKSHDITEDNSGSIYITGYAATGLPTTSGTIKESSTTTKNSFVSIFDRTLENLEASTYLGTSGESVGIEVNNANEVVIAGYSMSSDFPITADAYDALYQSYEGYVAKLDQELTTVKYGTFIGGNGSDYMSDLYLNQNDTVYVTGVNSSSQFPVTEGAYQSTYGIKISYVFIIPEEVIGLGATERIKNISKASTNSFDARAYGAYKTSKSLLSVQGGLGINLSMNYNSLSNDISSLGTGWRLNVDSKVMDLKSEFVSIATSSGNVKSFVKVGNEFEAIQENNHYDALSVDGNTITLTTDQRIFKTYENGLLVKESLKNGDSVTYVNENGKLTKVIDDKSGRYIEIIYSTSNTDLVDYLQDNSGRIVDFNYDANNHVSSIVDPEGVTTSFTYNNDGQLLTETVSKGLDSYLLYMNTYDENGCLESVEDNNPNNQPIVYSYDTETMQDHIIVTRTNQEGNSSISVYDQLYNLVSYTDEEGNMVETVYYEGRLIATIDASENETFYEYNPDGMISSVMNAKGFSTYYTYNVDKQLETISNSINGTTTYEYNDNFDISRIIQEVTVENPENYANGSYGDNPEEAITEYTYVNGVLDYIKSPEGYITDVTINSNGQLEKIEYKDETQNNVSNSESYTYDAVGRLTSVTDSLLNSYSVEYYDNDLLKKITNPLLEEQNYVYYPHGQLQSVSDYENEVTEYRYDNNLNLVEVIDPIVETPLDNTIQMIFDGMNRVISTVDRNGNATTSEYYKNSLVKKVIDAENVYQRYTYYPNGLLQSVFMFDPDTSLEKIVQDYVYDELGNVLFSSDALNNTQSNNYDGIGRLMMSTDAESNITQFNYDELNRLTSTIDASSYTSKQVLDLEGRLLYMQDSDDDFTSSQDYLHHYDYDIFGRLTDVYDAGVLSSHVSYQTNTNYIQTVTNGRGQVTSYEYDELGRTSKITDEINIREYVYDPVNNKNSILTKELVTENLLSTVEYEYDANGRITSYKNEAGDTIGYVYDPEGLLISLIYPGNKTVHYTYNGANQLETVTDWNNDVTTYGYNAIGELISTTRPNGTVETYTYYKNGWLKTKVDQDSSNNIISEFTYQYDNVGNIISEVGNGNNLTNDYNALYELNLQQNHDDQQVLLYELGYEYDTVGNITSESDENGITDTMTYGDGNKLSTFNGNTIIYDHDNNMTSGPLDGVMSTYTYNQRNELISVSNISASYDSEGIRTSITKGSQTTTFTVNPLSSYNQVLISEDELGVKTYYVYGLGLISEEVNETKVYYHFDRRGSTIALTDASEVVTDTFEYDAYGAVLNHTGTLSTPFRYVGQYGVSSDTDSLYFMMSRYYNVDIKRFINQDSLLGSISNILSTNQYAYLKGNPASNVDPQGTRPVDPDGNTTSEMYPERGIPEGPGETENTLYENNEYYKYHTDMISQITNIDTAIFEWDIWNFTKVYDNNKLIYENLSVESGIPPELIAALHYRESGADFDTYLHNGQPLGEPTTIVPQNVLYYDFEKAAVHALTTTYNTSIRDEFNLTSDSTDMAAMMGFAEKYNGLGYYLNDRVSPYIYSGTNVYISGKYVSDGNYDPNYVDKQPGVYLLINQIINRQ